ncbi:S8 family peptidase [Streptosporangium sp. NPDC000396]|uniref:S8 family peptidase n=1 Tax=Streptosporangium sp. NPDC000396 TaxID=3366185 RepID=UPI0036C1B636
MPTSPELVVDAVISRPLQERMASAADEPIGVVIELRSAHPGGVREAGNRVAQLIAEVTGGTAPIRFLGSYLAAALTAEQIRELARADTAEERNARDPAAGSPAGAVPSGAAPRWSIHRIWPNFEVGPLTYRSVVTTKCAAAHRAFGALGQDIVWAVLDSGIDAGHAHFARHGNLDLGGRIAHRSFVPGTSDADALSDAAGHGTHVAGILAGEQAPGSDGRPLVAAAWYQDDRGASRVQRLELPGMCGMAPRCRLLSCRVLRDDGSGDLTAVLAALQYIQEVNAGGRDLRVHGVNLSVGYPFDPGWFAAGLTPICREVDLLVRSGVVVVAAAGNTGYGYAWDSRQQVMRLGFDLTINDPGNSELAITVGATSSTPHTSGVSYFSSKGPTGDGRPKPDLVAPGERIVSAGTGALLKSVLTAVPDATYVEDSGTSMAAPHVSGVAAAFMSVHREFIGRPEAVKENLMRSATDLGRDRTFQGVGLVDAMRAIQRV